MRVEDEDWAGAYFRDVNLSRAKLDDVDLSGATIQNVDFKNAAFIDCDFSGAVIDGIPVLKLMEVYNERRR